MLQSFNDRLKGPFTWIIVISISFIFVITGMSFFLTNIGASSSYIAKVGKNEISSQQFQQYSQQATTESQKREVLGQLIDQYLILADAQRHNIQISKLALQTAIFTNPMFFGEDGKFSSDKLKQVVEYFGGLNVLEGMLSQNLKASIIPAAITDTVFITQQDKDLLLSVYSISKDIEYVKYTAKDFENQIKPTSEQTQQYYNTHKSSYINPAKAEVSYYVVNKDDFKSQLKISDQDIEQYYNENKNLFSKFDNSTKSTIKKILQNRNALGEYSLFTHNIDSAKFIDLNKKLGKAKVANIADNNKNEIEGLKNSLFFTKKDRFGALPLTDNKTIVYQVDKLIQASQKQIDEVKSQVTEAFINEKSKELVSQKASQTLSSLNHENKKGLDFTKTTLTADSKDLPKGFVDYVLSNSNSEYLMYPDQDGAIYIYKVTGIKPIKNDNESIPAKALNSYKQEEFNYYLQTIKSEIPVKINDKNI